jgi:hypothetical protein
LRSGGGEGAQGRASLRGIDHDHHGAVVVLGEQRIDAGGDQGVGDQSDVRDARHLGREVVVDDVEDAVHPAQVVAGEQARPGMRVRRVPPVLPLRGPPFIVGEPQRTLPAFPARFGTAGPVGGRGR